MPFIVTEPQRIEGTRLGYALYHYNFSFDEHLQFEKKYDCKLMIFKMKDSQFNEVEKILREEKFRYHDANKGYVDSVLKDFICQNAHYIVDFNNMKNYFERKNNYNLVGKNCEQAEKTQK